MRKDEVTIFRRSLESEVDRLQLSASDKLLDRLVRYYRLLRDWNRRIRLVGSTDPKRAASELFADSLLAADFASRFLPAERKAAMLDIGSGAGFPGVVAGLAYPEWSLTMVESDAKKAGFLKTLCRTVGFAGASVLEGRAEELAHTSGFRSRFELVFCRAVAPPRVAVELSVPFLWTGGSFVLQTSAGESQADVEEGGLLEKAIALMGASIEKTVSYNLSFPTSARLLLRVKKLEETPRQYPRRMKTMRRHPLG